MSLYQGSLSEIVVHTPLNQLNPDVELPEEVPRLKHQASKRARAKYDEEPNLGYPPDMNTCQVLQLHLLDNILEMEEKMFMGNLGSLLVKDRVTWRQNLESQAFDKLDTSLEKHQNGGLKNGGGRSSRSSTPDSTSSAAPREYQDPAKFLGVDSSSMQDRLEALPNLSDDHKVAIKALAIALAQVARGVEFRHLKRPLGRYYNPLVCSNVIF